MSYIKELFLKFSMEHPLAYVIILLSVVGVLKRAQFLKFSQMRSLVCT